MERVTLSIRRKMTGNPLLKRYQNLFQLQNNQEKFDKYLKSEELDETWLGELRFTTNIEGAFVEHISNDKEVQKQNVLFANGIPDSWLIPFKYHEMKVIGLDMGVFIAEAKVSEVMMRLYHLELPFGSQMDKERNAIYRFLEKNAKADDYLILRTNWYFHRDGDMYDLFQVQDNINRRVARIKKEYPIPYWTKEVEKAGA